MHASSRIHPNVNALRITRRHRTSRLNMLRNHLTIHKQFHRPVVRHQSQVHPLFQCSISEGNLAEITLAT